MRLVLFQILVMTCLAEGRLERVLQAKKRRHARLLSYRDQVRLGSEGQGVEMLEVEPNAFKDMLQHGGPGPAAEPDLVEAIHPAGGKMAGERKKARLSLPPIELHLGGSLGTWGLPDTENIPLEALSHAFPPPPPERRNKEPTGMKNAKKFWNLFLLRRNSASEELALPMKTEGMQQENCRTLPFSQSIVHENCEKVVVENNLCFGKCSSFHVPGPEDHLYTFCSHCLPTKFTMHRLQMNCTGFTTLVKVVMIVEECQCEVQRGKHTKPAVFQANLDTDVPESK
ncbi:cerberus [Lissotriton helveticus]